MSVAKPEFLEGWVRVQIKITSVRGVCISSGREEPQFNKEPKDCNNMFASTRFCNIKVLLYI